MGIKIERISVRRGVATGNKLTKKNHAKKRNTPVIVLKYTCLGLSMER